MLQNTLTDGFTKGFRIASSMQHPSVSNKYSNHPSAVLHSDVVSAKLHDEMAMNRIAGPFDIPTPANCIFSPLGVVPKKASGEFRLIHDLSFPRDNSVNSHIHKSHTAVQYELLDHCVSIIRSIGPNCLIAKADIKDAFRILPIHPEDYRLLGFTWRGKFYFDKCLPMGCSTSCQIFECFATALQWILKSKLGIHSMSHILDDFIFFGPANSMQCASSLQAFISLAESLNIPLRHNKTVYPTNVVSLHGIEIDTHEMRMRLPQDKLDDARSKIVAIYLRKKKFPSNSCNR